MLMNLILNRKKMLVVELLITLFSTTFLYSQEYTIEHLEPSTWWTNMHNPEVMLLVHGKNIGELIPFVDYDGVSVTNVIQPSNSNYLFIFFKIDKNTLHGKFPIFFKKNTKTVLTYIYELKKRGQESANRLSFGPYDVVYLLMPDRFANGDTTNDSVEGLIEKADRSNPGGRHGGDIQGIIDHLDYLNDLGITAIWATPLLEDDMPVFSYHTYAISNYYKIDARYGTNEDYVRLADECHKRNIKLIMDVVPNHCGSNHWWMNDLPMEDWVHQFPVFTRSNYRISVWNDPYASNIDTKLNEDGWFDVTMPDLNQNNPLLLTYLIQSTIYWIEIANLDGLRVDTYPYNNKWKIAEWTKAIREEYPNLNIMGECWRHRTAEIAYWQSGVENYDGYDSFLPTVMDFTLNDAFMAAFNEDTQHWVDGVGRFYNNYVMDYLYSNPFNLLVFVDNHDTERFTSQIDFDINKFKLGMIHLLTTRGIPQIYYGTEIMMGGVKNFGDGDIRRDFPGGWPGDKRNAFTKEGRANKENEAFNFLHALLNYRKNNAVLQTGRMVHFVPEKNVYVYFRMNDIKTLMVILNNSTIKTQLNTERYKECTSGVTKGINILNNEKINLNSLEIMPKTGMVIEFK